MRSVFSVFSVVDFDLFTASCPLLFMGLRADFDWLLIWRRGWGQVVRRAACGSTPQRIWDTSSASASTHGNKAWRGHLNHVHDWDILAHHHRGGHYGIQAVCSETNHLAHLSRFVLDRAAVPLWSDYRRRRRGNVVMDHWFWSSSPRGSSSRAVNSNPYFKTN